MLLSRIITIIFDAVMAQIIVKYTKQPHRLYDYTEEKKKQQKIQ